MVLLAGTSARFEAAVRRNLHASQPRRASAFAGLRPWRGTLKARARPAPSMAAPAEEWLDVLDEAGRVAGKLPREEVHRRALLHRSVHVFVFDPAGKLWLQKRALDRALNPGLWTSSASGHLASGEPEAEGAAREVEEEIGLRVEPRRVGEFRHREGLENEVCSLWEARTDQPARPGPEVLAVMAVDRGELDALRARLPGSFAPSFGGALRAYGWA
jgi:isopentenyldiphosphate isomerase